METARNLIGIIVRRVFKFPARVKLGHDHFGGRNAFFGVNAGGDAAPIIFDRNRSIRIERDNDPVTVASQCFINRIVRNLKHHVMQAAAIIGIADIHAGALADSVKAFKYLNRVCAIFIRIGYIFLLFSHEKPIGRIGLKAKEKRHLLFVCGILP